MINNFEFLTLEKNGTLLHGAKSETKQNNNSIAIHIHGSWGNFYENPFALELAGTYNQQGFDYASVNLSGHDGGTINESFADSVEEIIAWSDLLGAGKSNIVLQGHSLGALKLIRLANDPNYESAIEKLSGLVLLSPFDLVAFYGGPNVERRRSHAKEFRDANGENALVPDSIFDGWPISVGTFLDLSEPEGDYDIFPTRLGVLGELDETKIPRLVVLGEQDNACYPGAENVMAVLESSSCLSEMIPGASHNFAGKEDELSKVISKFISSL